MSSTTRWVVCAICAVIGVIAVIYALIYLTVPIHSLPGFVPGKKPVNGHYHKRAALTGVIGIVLIVVAFVLALASRKPASSGADTGIPESTGAPATEPQVMAGTTPEASETPQGAAASEGAVAAQDGPLEGDAAEGPSA